MSFGSSAGMEILIVLNVWAGRRQRSITYWSALSAACSRRNSPNHSTAPLTECMPVFASAGPPRRLIGISPMRSPRSSPRCSTPLARIVDLPAENADGGFAPRHIPLSDEAREEVFEEFRRFVYTGKYSLDGREREWWAKTPAHVVRLAGTLAYLDWAMRGGDEPKEIEAKFMKGAVRLVRDYFWPHSRAALRQIGLSERHANARRVLRWIKADNRRNEVSREDLRRDALGQSLDADQTQSLIDGLVKTGWLREITKLAGPSGGRPARRWFVNPMLFVAAHTAEIAEIPDRSEIRAVSAVSAVFRGNGHAAPSGDGLQ